MLAAYFREGAVEIVERPTPEPGPGWALLKVRMAGICNTDLELLQGYYGFAGVAGHEFVADVVSAPDAQAWEGRRVTADINFACEQCELCAAGRQRHCPSRTVLGIVAQEGAFAEYCLAPVTNLVEVPVHVPDEEAVFAEPLAAALEVGQQVHITGRDRVLVVGDGKLGLLVALGLRYQCPGLVLAGRHEDKLSLAREQGVRTEMVHDVESMGDLARRLGRFDVVVEVSGKPGTLQQALSLVRPEGTVVVKTTSRERSEIDLAAVVVDEISIVGSRCGDIGLAMSYLGGRWVDTRPLVEKKFSFADFEEAIAAARRPGARKVLLSFRE